MSDIEKEIKAPPQGERDAAAIIDGLGLHERDEHAYSQNLVNWREPFWRIKLSEEAARNMYKVVNRRLLEAQLPNSPTPLYVVRRLQEWQTWLSMYIQE